MRGKPLSKETWRQIQTAYAAGIGLRELARNAGIPEGTVLCRAKLDGWTQEKQEAQALAASQSTSINTGQAVANSLYERGLRHVNRMAAIAERTIPVVENMSPETVLDSVEKVDRLDRLARRQYGLDEVSGARIGLQINFLSHPTTEERGTTIEADCTVEPTE